MRKVLCFTLLLLTASCATNSKSARKVASVERDISGTFLAVSAYRPELRGLTKAATRIYLQEIEGEKGRYHVVLLEYVDLIKMAPSYIISNKLPIVANKVGYLNSITKKIAAYKAFPTEVEGKYEMYPLVVNGDQIVEKRDVSPRILTLAKNENLTYPLEGATISPSLASDPDEIFFPKEEGDDKKHGIQYSIAKLVYAKAKLESTWRKNFLPGPYLSQYAKVDDVVLQLTHTDSADTAEFKLNPEAANVPIQKREKVFTHKDSAFLVGEYNVTEPLDGMFLFNPTVSNEHSAAIIKGKIGLFIDVFDATKSLNQDVVELALIDSEKPENFLMYYEHPGNGEGK